MADLAEEAENEVFKPDLKPKTTFKSFAFWLVFWLVFVACFAIWNMKSGPTSASQNDMKSDTSNIQKTKTIFACTRVQNGVVVSKTGSSCEITDEDMENALLDKLRTASKHGQMRTLIVDCPDTTTKDSAPKSLMAALSNLNSIDGKNSITSTKLWLRPFGANENNFKFCLSLAQIGKEVHPEVLEGILIQDVLPTVRVFWENGTLNRNSNNDLFPEGFITNVKFGMLVTESVCPIFQFVPFGTLFDLVEELLYYPLLSTSFVNDKGVAEKIQIKFEECKNLLSKRQPKTTKVVKLLEPTSFARVSFGTFLRAYGGQNQIRSS